MTRQADVQRSMNDVSGDGQAEKTSKLRTFDQTALQARMSKLRAEIAQKEEAEAQKEREIVSRVVADADVEIVATALNISAAAAKRKLQERNGDVTAVLRDAVGLGKARA
jgi:NACalpha-BTF3-like transcription factor